MRYAGIIRNDLSAAPGVCLTVFVQGCPNHCPGCHNQETWDFNGGYEFTEETMKSIIKDLTANGVKRDLCIMGGEPLCEANKPLTSWIIHDVKAVYPDIKVYVWTGFKYEDIDQSCLNDVDFLIDGRFEQDKRDVRLFMRGSSNQRILDLTDWKHPHISTDLMKGSEE